MTREEAKQNLHYGLQFGTLKANVFIDSIYDDFENRSCDNCRYSKKHERYQVLVCKRNISNYNNLNSVDHDFCCNKWEAKT